MKINFTFKSFLCIALFAGTGSTQAQETTFDFTGAVQTYTVPLGVTSIQIEAWGAQGGGSEPCGGPIEDDGGLGGFSSGNLAVTPGQILNIYVGGKPITNFGTSSPGGFNGGGVAGQYGGGGGGASDVRVGGVSLSDRLIVAGGGGGGNAGCPNHGTGGVGGGYTGGNGISFLGWGTATGGTPLAGGIGSSGGSNGAFGVGGTGAYHVAGGGGGWYGGGGAYAAGAGGGSSYTDGVTEGATLSGIRTGHGQIIITVLCSGITVTVSDDVICLGDSFTLEGSGLGTISWDGGVENGVPFTPAAAGVFTYTSSSDDGGDCGYSLDIEVIAVPVVVAAVDETEVCLGESVIFTGSGADTYSWDMGVTDGVAFEPGVGAATYTVTGTDAVTGCENTDEIEVIVNDLPTVVANATDNEICLGESFTLTGSGATAYAWTPDGTLDGEEITPDATGTTTYEVTGTDDNGCVNTASIEVTVYDAVTITYTTEDEMMGADGSIDITVTGGNPTYSFDWDNDGTGDFDDTEDLTGLAGGTYVVVIEDEAGCSATETIVLNSQLGIEINVENNISIYPNPTTAHITILAAGSFTYEITDVNGQIVLVANGVDTEEVSLEELASGIYFVNLTIADELTTIRIVKN
jgi:hypothetical protein